MPDIQKISNHQKLVCIEFLSKIFQFPLLRGSDSTRIIWIAITKILKWKKVFKDVCMTALMNLHVSLIFKYRLKPFLESRAVCG